MPECRIKHIPNRLKWKGRPIQDFQINEELYMRCIAKERENPYHTRTPVELSHNRSGVDKSLSEPNDVLYNILPSSDITKHEDMVVCTIQIMSLNDESKYSKTFKQLKGDKENVGILELLHEPEECMFPHCVFRLTFNGEVVTYDNCNDTINTCKLMRTEIKQELAKMIVKEELHQINPQENEIPDT